MEDYINIYQYDYSRNPEGDLMQKVIKPGDEVPVGWTTDLDSLGYNTKTEQDQINKNLTLQLAQANVEIAKLKAQIGGAK